MKCLPHLGSPGKSPLPLDMRSHRSPRMSNLVVQRNVSFTSYHALGHHAISNLVGFGYPIKGNFRYGGSEAKMPTNADTWI